VNTLWDNIYVMFIELYIEEDPFAILRGNYDSLYIMHGSTNRSSNRPSF
jgi:hypothetical protein